MPDAPIRSLYFADASSPDEQGVSAPFEVLRVGKTNHPAFGETNITEADLEKAVANFKSMQSVGADVPVDYDHSFAEGGESRAAGWIKDLYRQGRSLFARVKWTDAARKLIGADEYRYISAEFSEDWKDQAGDPKGFTLLAAGLTNRPFLKDLGPVALSERIPVEDVRFVLPAAEIKLPPPTETHGEVADEKTKTQDEKDAKTVTLSAADHKDLTEKAKAFDEAEQDRADAKKEAETKSEEAKSFKDEVTTLSTRLSDMEKQLLSERLKGDLGQARREGRIDATDETTKKWTERYEKLGRETARELLFELPAETIPVTERGHGGDKPAAESVPEGTDPEAAELDAEIREYMDKNDEKDYGKAFSAVAAQKVTS